MSISNVKYFFPNFFSKKITAMEERRMEQPTTCRKGGGRRSIERGAVSCWRRRGGARNVRTNRGPYGAPPRKAGGGSGAHPERKASRRRAPRRRRKESYRRANPVQINEPTSATTATFSSSSSSSAPTTNTTTVTPPPCAVRPGRWSQQQGCAA